MNTDDANHIRQMIEANRRRLRELEVQAAKLGSYCPAHIRVDIKDTRDSIADFEQQLDQQVIGSYLEGRKTARDFGYDLDAIEHKLNQMVVRETRVYRFFGIPVFSVSTVISRVFTLFMVLIGLSFLALLMGFITQTVVVRDQKATAEAAERLQQTAQAAVTAKAGTATSVARTATSVAATTTALAGTATAAQVAAATGTVSARLATETAATAQAVAATASARPTDTPTKTLKPTARARATSAVLPPTLEPPTEAPFVTPVPVLPTDTSLPPTSTLTPTVEARPRSTRAPASTQTPMGELPSETPAETPTSELPSETPAETPTSELPSETPAIPGTY